MIKDEINTALQVAFAPQTLLVENESFRHNVPEGSEDSLQSDVSERGVFWAAQRQATSVGLCRAQGMAGGACPCAGTSHLYARRVGSSGGSTGVT